MLRLLLAAGRAVTSRVPWLGGLAHRYGPICLGVVAKLQGRCRVGGGVFTTRERFITLAAAGEMLKDTYEINERWALDAVLDPDLPVIDCGASLGIVACLVNRRLTHPEHHVAVEANPDLLPVLARHRAMNGAQFQVLHAAVAYGAAQVDFNISGNSLAGSLAGRGGAPGDRTGGHAARGRRPVRVRAVRPAVRHRGGGNGHPPARRGAAG